MKRLIFSILIICICSSISSFAVTWPADSVRMEFKLHGQTRRYTVTFQQRSDSLWVNWSIQRNFRWQSGSYVMSSEACSHARNLNYRQPVDGETVVMDDATFALLSKDALSELRDKRRCRYNCTEYVVEDSWTDASGRSFFRLKDIYEDSRMTVLDNMELPLIVSMQSNPVEIDWQIIIDD